MTQHPPIEKVDICIIGGGAGGLSVAAGAVQMGASVILIEAEKMGGDCLNFGCVPSKSLLAAAKTAQLIRTADVFGLQVSQPQINIATVMRHVHDVIATLAVNDSVEGFTKLGVKVIKAQAKFKDERTLMAGEHNIRARRYVIATGSFPVIPPIAGLADIKFYTNETIFELHEMPEHLLVIGGGPIGCELAQAFLLLGVKVTLLEMFTILPRDEADMVEILREELIQQGMMIYEKAEVSAITQHDSKVEVNFMAAGQSHSLMISHVLVAAGREIQVADLDLAAAKVEYSNKHIAVDASLRTKNSRIYAIGDVVGQYQFTHVANYHAGIVLRNILFRLPAKVSYRAVPWVTYTHPELAHVGLSASEALKLNPKSKILTSSFRENDRAQTEHQVVGKIKVMTDRKGKILGATILGVNAGELLLPWINAVAEKKHIRSMTNLIVPYPTLSEISKRVAGEFYTPILFSKRTKWIVRLLSWLG